MESLYRLFNTLCLSHSCAEGGKLCKCPLVISQDNRSELYLKWIRVLKDVWEKPDSDWNSLLIPGDNRLWCHCVKPCICRDIHMFSVPIWSRCLGWYGDWQLGLQQVWDKKFFLHMLLCLCSDWMWEFVLHCNNWVQELQRCAVKSSRLLGSFDSKWWQLNVICNCPCLSPPNSEIQCRVFNKSAFTF